MMPYRADRRSAILVILLLFVSCFTRIQATAQTVATNRPEDLYWLCLRMQDLAAGINEVTVSVSGGSGVVVSDDGYVLTAAHVAQKPGRNVIVTFSSGDQYHGITLGLNRGTDVGLVKIDLESRNEGKDDNGKDGENNEGSGLPFANLNRSFRLNAGSPCVAAGYPISYDAGKPAAIRLGHLIQLDDQKLLSTCKIMGGDSGGPVFDIDGNLIAVTSRIVSGDGISVHAPIDAILRDWDRMVGGEVIDEKRQGDPLNDAVLKLVMKKQDALQTKYEALYSGLCRAVVRVMSNQKQLALGTVVGEGLVLTKASELPRDFQLISISGDRAQGKIVAVDERYDLALIRAHLDEIVPITPPYEPVDVSAGRLLFSIDYSIDYKQQSVASMGVVTSKPRTFTISEEDYAANNDRGFLGVMVGDSNDSGLAIIRLVAGSAAEEAGLKLGDQLVSMAGEKLKSARHLARLLDRKGVSEKVEFEIFDANTKSASTITITLGLLPERFHGLQVDRWGGGPFSKRRFDFPKVLPHDGVIAPHECGGPIFDLDGSFVGINVARALTAHTLAIEATELQTVLAKLQQFPPPTLPERFDQINAAGIPGVLVLNGSGKVSDETIEAFVKDGPGAWKQGANEDGNRDRRLNNKCDCCVLDFLQKPSADDEKAETNSVAQRIAAVEVDFEIDVRSITIENTKIEHAKTIDEIISRLEKATHVWIEGDDRRLMQSVLTEKTLLVALRKLLDRDGTIGGNANFSTLTGAFAELTDSLDESPTIAPALNLIPQAIVLSDELPAEKSKARASQLLKADASLFALRLGRSSTLVLAGRSLVRNDTRIPAYSPDVNVSRVQFAKSDEWAGETLTLTRSRTRADLTAVRRFALRRTGLSFPAAKISEPIVENGTLMIIGGGGTPKGLLKRYVELAGGEEANIVVIPISSAPPLPRRERIAVSLRKLGAKEVTVLRGRTPEDVTDAKTLAALREATGIWFGGGRQWRFVDAYEDTESLKLIHDVLKRGGVIAGSSAGASIQGDFLNRGNPLGSQYPSADGYERGFAFLPGTAIDQHFAQRDRFADLGGLIERHPQMLGIGIDESTAFVVDKKGAKVVGENSVWLYDRRSDFLDKQSSGYEKSNYVEYGDGDSVELRSHERDAVAQ